MKVQRSKGILLVAFRILSLLSIALLCDFWFYIHMVTKWHSLDQNNTTYRKNIAIREWKTADIRALFGSPDRTTSNSLDFTAFDFSRSRTVFPITEIFLTLSVRHIERRDVEFIFGYAGLVCGYSDSNGEGFLKYKRKPKPRTLSSNQTNAPATMHSPAYVDPSTFKKAWVMSSGWSGFMGVALAITENRYYYWFYSDVPYAIEPEWPLVGSYKIVDGKLSLSTNELLYASTWIIVTNKGRECLWADRDVGDYRRLLIPDPDFNHAKPFKNQALLNAEQPKPSVPGRDIQNSATPLPHAPPAGHEDGAKSDVRQRFYLNWNLKPVNVDWNVVFSRLGSQGYNRTEPLILDIENISNVIAIAVNKQINLMGTIYNVQDISNHSVTIIDSHGLKTELMDINDAFNVRLGANGTVTMIRGP